jgi:hypothetical protein
MGTPLISRSFHSILSQILHAFFMAMTRQNRRRIGIPDWLSGKI